MFRRFKGQPRDFGSVLIVGPDPDLLNVLEVLREHSARFRD